MKGAFQTSREIFENPIWQDIPKFRIFFYIVGNAVYAEEGAVVAGLHLKRGQFLRAYRNLIKDLEYIENRSIKRYSLSVISRKIDQLVKEERLKIEDTELGTLFTVVNYAQYQGFDYYKKRTWDSVGTELEQSWNGDGTELEQGWNNNNKDKKDNKVKKEKNKEIYSTEFESFWNEYPRKIAKQEAAKTFQKVVKAGEDPALIIQCAKNYKAQCDRLKTDQQYIKHPKTFLNEERYKDYQEGGGAFGKHPGGNAGHPTTNRADERGKDRIREPKPVSREVIREINNFE